MALISLPPAKLEGEHKEEIYRQLLPRYTDINKYLIQVKDVIFRLTIFDESSMVLTLITEDKKKDRQEIREISSSYFN